MLAIVGGFYWVVRRSAGAQDASLVRQRLRKAAAPGKLTKALLNEPTRLSDVGAFDRLLTASGRLVGPLQRMIQQSGLKVTVGVVLLSCLVRGSAGLRLLSLVYLRLPLLGIPVRAAWRVYLPIGYIKSMRNRRMLKFDEQFPEAMDLLARALARRPCADDRALDGRGRDAGPARSGVQAALRPAELRPAAAAGAAGISPTASRRSTRGSS